MRLYISTLSKRFVHSATYTALLDGFTFKRHDVEPIELHFLDENGLVEIPAKFIGKALFVAGSYDEFNGKYLPTGSSENGKPVWEKAGIKIKYVSENTYAVSAAIVTNAPTYFLNGKYLPDTILNGKTCYKNTATQNRFEWKPAETVMGDGVLLTGESTFAGLYSLDGSANSTPSNRLTHSTGTFPAMHGSWGVPMDRNRLNGLSLLDAFLMKPMAISV